MPINPIELTKDIQQNYANYLSGTFYIKDQNLRNIIIKEIESYPFIKGPYLESIPPFKKGEYLKDFIKKGLLSNIFTNFIYEALPYLRDNPLYLHQDKAIRKLLDNRNLIISSGTGSGKTECFLITIYNHLLREYEENMYLEPGVRALLLYPMNALANDQLRRLREITKVMEEKIPDVKITFGRYTGDTKDESRESATQRFMQRFPNQTPAENELLTRGEMQETPPHILITNYAMLEYLLIRPGDKKFFDGEYAKSWKFLVLDEAHIYNGAKGIEMALLIRRLKDRVCKNMKGDLLCIATSATLVSEAEDYTKVTKFASDLFGELFEWDENEKNKQDIIEGKRLDIELSQATESFPLNIYSSLHSLIFEESIDKVQSIYDMLKEQGIEKEILEVARKESNRDLKKFVYNFLAFDKRILDLKMILKDGSKDLDKFMKIILQKENPSKTERQSIIDLINLSVWAKIDDDSLPLLPARYHLFIRAPEGIFISFYPTEQIFLERREETHDKKPVFELAACRRCGQEYFVGFIKDNELKHSFSELPLSERGNDKITNQYFIFWPKSIEFEEDEDQEISLPEDLSIKGEQWELCIKCGRIYKNDELKCKCQDDVPIKRTLIEIKPKNIELNKCYSCSHRSPFGIVRKFIFNQNDLNSVLVTVLYQNLNKTIIENNELKKILAFSDSRQGAAYFAPFLQAEYDKILFRRLIIKALDANIKYKDYGLSSLYQDVSMLARNYNLLEHNLDDKQRSQIVWRWIIHEFCALFDNKRNSLERVGMLFFKPSTPKNWVPPPELLNPPWSLTEQEVINLYYFLLNTMRYNFAITLPSEVGLDPSDAFFRPLNKEYKFRGEISDSKKHIHSFIPSKRYLNSRLDIVKKLFNKIVNRNDEDNEYKKILGIIWNDLRSNWRGHGIFGFNIPKEGIVFQLDHNYWRVVRRRQDEQWYFCDKCGIILPFSVRGVCPTFNCLGEVRIIDTEFEKSLKYNFYRTMYSKFNPIKMISQEHTAQLTSDYATEVQQKFIDGDINILSCSTTFELGVDLGTLEAIFLRNVPPEPSNYVQRAGRAGRRLDTIGYTITFAHLRSHDLSYFKTPEKMIDGRIKPPELSLTNQKIVRRHIHSIVLAKFFQLYEKLYGSIESFLHLSEDFSGIQLLKDYLESKPQSILTSIKRVVPELVKQYFCLDTWEWVEGLVGRNGTLTTAEEKITLEYDFLSDYYNQKQQQWIKTSNQDEKDKFNSDMRWANKRIETIKKKNLIDFLASNTVIPKYGFPVDVVDLLVLSKSPAAKQIELERDLRIGLSEFAPGSEVVANKYIWKSEGLRVLRNRTWTIYWYAICPYCERIFMELGSLKEKPPKISCNIHGSLNKYRYRFIIPEFGFTTNIQTPPRNAALFRPRKQFTTRPYFYDYGEVEQKEISIKKLKINIKYGKHGELAVICKGKEGVGFRICPSCGAAFAYDKRLTSTHISPFGWECKRTVFGPRIHLGHKFMTDVVSLTFIKPQIRENQYFGLSLLYGVLQGISKGLGIKRNDLDGCLHQTKEGMVLILFDNVPGGAGHVRRLLQEENLYKVFESTLSVLENCSCGPETSCYSCLRNYQNQFCHHLLRRGLVSKFLKDYLGYEKEKKKQKEIDDKLLVSIGRQGEQNAYNYIRKLKIEELRVDEDPETIIIDKKDGFIIKCQEKELIDVTWENAIEEKYKGYDISYRDDNKIKHYIEVKSTTSSSRSWFNITENEWKYFLDKKERYFIFRVYNVELGKLNNENIEIIKNPYKEWIEGKIMAYPYKLEI